MKYSTKLMLTGLLWVNGMTVGSADVVVDGQVIDSADISSISIDPVSGDINVTAGGLYTVTRDSEPPSGPNVVINSFTASSNTILEGQSVTISWTTTDADSCTPSGGGGGWSSQSISLPSGVSSSLTIATAGNYTFRLDCQNATPSSTFRTVTVQVNSDTEPPEPSNCTAPTINGSVATWADIFNTQWPDPRLTEQIVAIPRSGYLAIEFNTGNVQEDGGFTTITHTSTSGNRLGSISECPGDFSEALPGSVFSCTELMYIGGGVGWNSFTSPKSGFCNLQPNTTYYLNLTFTDGESSTTDRCEASSSCRTILRVWR